MHDALREFGLRPDADERAVKRAYAARLKTTRPEDDPEGFQRLHEAYQAALDWLQSPRYEHDYEVLEDDATLEPALPAEVLTQPRPSETPTLAAETLSQRAEVDNRHTDTFDAHDGFDLAAFLDQCVALAVRSRDGELPTWLNAQPALWSLTHKAQVGQWLLRHLHERRPPIQDRRFDVLASFFGLTDLHSGYDAYVIQRLRHRLHLAWEIQTEQLRALAVRTGQDGGSVASNLRQTQRILRQLSQPLRWPQALWAGLTPGYPSAVRRFMQGLDFGNLGDLPSPIRGDQIAFWDAAGDRSHFSKARWAVSVARLFAYTLVVSLLFMLVTSLNGANTVDGVLGLAPSVFASIVFALMTAAWLLHLALETFGRWQALSDHDDERWSWLRLSAVPALVAIGWAVMQVWPHSEIIGIVVGLLFLFAAYGAWVRHRERSGPPLGRHLGYWRAFFVVLLFRSVGDALGWVDDTGFLALISALTLFIWAKDLWIQRPARQSAARED